MGNPIPAGVGDSRTAAAGIDVHGMDRDRRSELGRDYGQDACSAPHVQNRLPFKFPAHPEQLFDHHGSGLVMAAAETHLGIYDDVDTRLGKILVICRPHRHLAAYDDRFEIALPDCVPVLLPYEFDRMGQFEAESGEAAEDDLEIGFREKVLRNVSVKERILDRETVEAEVNDPGFDYFRPFFAEGLDSDMYSYVIHDRFPVKPGMTLGQAGTAARMIALCR